MLSGELQFRYCCIHSFIPMRNAINTAEYETFELKYGIVLWKWKSFLSFWITIFHSISRDCSIFCSRERRFSLSSIPSFRHVMKWLIEVLINSFARYWNWSGVWKIVFIWFMNCSPNISHRRECNSSRSFMFSRVFGVSWIFSMVKITRVNNRIIKDTKVKFLFWLLFHIFKIE